MIELYTDIPAFYVSRLQRSKVISEWSINIYEYFVITGVVSMATILIGKLILKIRF